MAIDTRISFFGLGIDYRDPSPLFYGLSIDYRDPSPLFYGLGIQTDAYFNATLKIIGFDQAGITNASVTSSATDIKGITNAEGKFELTGSTTIGNLVTVQKEGKASIKFPLPTLADGTVTYCLPDAGGGASKKIYTTNKGNVLINPNDTILIELD